MWSFKAKALRDIAIQENSRHDILSFANPEMRDLNHISTAHVLVLVIDITKPL